MKYTIDTYSIEHRLDSDGDLAVRCIGNQNCQAIYIPACEVSAYARRMIQFFTPLAQPQSPRGTFED